MSGLTGYNTSSDEEDNAKETTPLINRDVVEQPNKPVRYSAKYYKTLTLETCPTEHMKRYRKWLAKQPKVEIGKLAKEKSKLEKLVNPEEFELKIEPKNKQKIKEREDNITAEQEKLTKQLAKLEEKQAKLDVELTQTKEKLAVKADKFDVKSILVNAVVDLKKEEASLTPRNLGLRRRI